MEKIKYVCPENQQALQLNIEDNCYLSTNGKEYQIINSIPRFVDNNHYAFAFGLQWKKFRKTQLDSYTGTDLSRNRLERICGGNLDIFQNKNVLEVGCGAGRFSEILLKSGASLYATDLSNAVEANFENCRDFENYSICQADVRWLPFKENTFDIVIGIGVIQHTPNPEKTIINLVKYLKHGGLLMIDHYTYGYPVNLTRKILRKIFLIFPNKHTITIIKILGWMLWPLHKIFWKLSITFKKSNRGYRLRKFFLNFSPILDYHDVYPELNNKQLYEWTILDTHDTLTDRYKHLRSVEEITLHLKKCGLKDIKTWIGGNGVESVSVKK